DGGAPHCGPGGGISNGTLAFGVGDRRANRSPPCACFCLLVASVFAAKPAILATLQPLRIVLLVLHRGIIAPLAVSTGQCNDLSHAQPLEDPYARMVVTMPEPTVLPPSRIAKRSPWSIAIGEIRSAVIVTLSPGITISTPPSSATTPLPSAPRQPTSL